MCEFCIKHGEGKKWYLRAKNYSIELAEELKVKEAAAEFGSNFPRNMDMGWRLLKFIKKTPKFLQNMTRQIHSMWQKKMHYGQIIPIEDVEEIFKKMSTIVRLPCLCREYNTSDKNPRYCMGITMDPIRKDYADTVDHTFYGGPDLHGLEYLTFDEVMKLEHEYEKQGLIHTVWTLKTPFVVSICNCNILTCTAFQLRQENLRVMFKAEYVAIVDPDLCKGCRACMENCHFDAIQYNDETKKIMIDPAKCTGCGICRAKCPTGAISLIDRRKHVIAKDLWY